MYALRLGLLLLVACGEPQPAVDLSPDDPVLGGRWANTEPLTAGVVEYSTEVQVGTGPYDRFGLHRVVADPPNGPAVFLVHGANGTFETQFMGETLEGRLRHPQSFAVFLADQGYDVWGIDVRGSLVPRTETSLESLADWDLELHAQDIHTAMGIARLVRWTEGGGGEPMPLLGFSRGGSMVYAAAGAEAHLPPPLRHISALVVLDSSALPYADETARTYACIRYDRAASRRSQGLFIDAVNSNLSDLGASALELLEDGTDAPLPPPYVPFTVRQLALVIQAQPWVLGAFDLEFPTPWFHGNAGSYQSLPPVPPTGLAYTDQAMAFAHMASARGVLDLGTTMDIEQANCGDRGFPAWQVDFDRIRLPILQLGAAGGIGDEGFSTDVSGGDDTFPKAQVDTLQITDAPPGPCFFQDPTYGNRRCAFGHSDLMFSDEAQDLVWNPLVDWLGGL